MTSQQTESFDCFISHASSDYPDALKLVTRLEEKGLSCWIAPRNIAAGADYAEAIVVGVSSCRSLVVLISKDSLSSRHVRSEVSLADGLGKKIFPVKLVDIEIYGGLSFYLSTSQEIRLYDKGVDPVEALVQSIEGSESSLQNSERPTRSVNPNKRYVLIAVFSMLGVGAVFLGTLYQRDTTSEKQQVHDDALAQTDKSPESLKKDNRINCENSFERRTIIEIPTVLENTSSECDYYVAPKTTVDLKSDVTIEPGTKIVMGLGSSLNFRGGSVSALGEKDEQIYIVGEKDIVGYWKGITFRDLRSGKLSYLNVENGGSGKSDGVEFVSKNLKLSIENTKVAKSYNYGMSLSKSTELIGFSKNEFYGNTLSGISVHWSHLKLLDLNSDYLGRAEKNGVQMIDLGSVSVNDNAEVPNLGVPYVVDKITVSRNSRIGRLTIDSGVKIAVRAAGKISIQGDLTINGSEQDPVIFVPFEEKGWSSFSAGGNSVLKNVVIDGAGNGKVFGLIKYWGAVQSSWLSDKYYRREVQNVTIKNSHSYGVYCTRLSDESYAELKRLVDVGELKFEDNSLGDISPQCSDRKLWLKASN